MGRFDSVLFPALLFAISAFVVPASAPAIDAEQPQAASALVLPAGTKVNMIVTRPVWAATAKAGDVLYAQTSFPVVAGTGIAIPPGTYVQGTIKRVTRPTRRTNRAEIVVLFTKFIFAGGYVVPLPGDPGATEVAEDGVAGTGPGNAAGEALIAIAIRTTTANDLLLDNGAIVEMTLGAPLALDAQQVAAAVPVSRAPDPVLMRSASRCTFTPGDP